jgi:hypothetical protein
VAEPLAPPARAARTDERRSHPRHSCGLGVLVHYLTRPTFSNHWAGLRDLSTEGAGLTLGWAPELGTIVLLGLAPPCSWVTYARLARVVRAERKPGGYVVGCRFGTPLSEEELVGVLRQFGPPPAS